MKLNAQDLSADFTLPVTTCIYEDLIMTNTSKNAVSYNWDFCLDDFFETPVIDNNFGSSFSTGRGFKIVKDNNLFFGFIINNLNLYRVEFGESLDNINPIITDLGDFGGLIDNAEGIDIVKEGNQWIAITGFGSSGNLGNVLRFIWSDLMQIPTVENLGSWGISGRLMDIKIVRQLGNYIVIAPNFNLNKLVRINFGDSMTNIPMLSDINESNTLTNVSFSSTLSIVKKLENWMVIFASRSTKEISIFSLGNDVNTEPAYVKSQIFTSFEKLDKIDVVRDNNNFFALISTRNAPTHLVNLKELNDTDVFEELHITSMPILYALDTYKENSKYFVFGTQNKLQRLIFESFCDNSIDYADIKNPLINFTQPNNYPIDLIAYNTEGDYDYITKTITISPSFAPQPASQIIGNCISSPISFDGLQVSGDIVSWNWNFGDGLGTAVSQNVSYTYGTAGEYQVKLNVTDANGCNNLVIDTVQVYEEPLPNFNVPVGNLCMNNAIAFTNISMGETGDVVTWTWDFNGEGSSNEKNPAFIFLSPGGKTITLTSSIPGCANVTQQTITIEEAPTTSFSFNNTCNRQTTTFTDETTGVNLTMWNWDFGDGNTSTAQSPIHTYSIPGKYVVTLSVSNILGCTTTKVDTVYNHDIPVINFTNDLACSTSPIQFTDQSLVDNANMVAWEWDFGDGTTSTEQSPEYLYNQIGDFAVKLKAYSQYGCVDSTETAITVAQGPQVDFEWDKACQGEATSFTDLTNSFGVSITNWNWIVDGTLLTNQNPTYTFANSGTHTVQLSVTVNNHCAQTMTQDIVVEVPPTVLFDYSEGCGGSGTSFYDLTYQTDDPIIAREWRVDGSVISTDSIATTLLDPGTYSVTLSVITNAGCEETTTSNVSLIGSPVAAFDVNTIYGATPLQVDFKNQSTGGSTYLWSFDDSENTTSSEQNPVFTYNSIGLYTITLRTSSDPSCYDETTQQIEVVEAESSAEIIAITPGTTNDITNFVITIENSGTNIIDNRSNLVFRADYGTEVIEPINTIIYAGKTVNYSASYAIPSNSNASAICAELVDSQKVQLDRSCININSSIHISEPYPNPSKGRITVDVMLEKASAIKVRVINRSGQPVLTQSFDGTKGLNKLLIDAQALPQGLYIIEVNSGDKTEQFKTSIIR